MCIVAFLKDETTLRLTYVIGICRAALTRHMTIPKLELQAAVYGVRLRRQILREHDVKNWQNLSLGRFTYSLTVVKVSSQETTGVCCQPGSRNTGKLFHWSMKTCQRRWKPSRYCHKSDVHRRPQGVWVVKWTGIAPDKKRKVTKAVVPSGRSWSKLPVL